MAYQTEMKKLAENLIVVMQSASVISVAKNIG